MMDDGRPFDYRPGTQEWSQWMAGILGCSPRRGRCWSSSPRSTPPRRWRSGCASNLTHRGILTHGAYGWTRHPAYLSKNLFWWISTVPILSTGSIVDAGRGDDPARRRQRHLLLARQDRGAASVRRPGLSRL
ncbi:DUF1295 domain-containing protein [Sphingomonas sp. MMS24-JH45]